MFVACIFNTNFCFNMHIIQMTIKGFFVSDFVFVELVDFVLKAVCLYLLKHENPA